LAEHLRNDDPWNNAAGQLVFPDRSYPAPYYGFAIGPESVHDLVDVHTDDGVYRLGPGMILPVTTSRARITPVRQHGAVGGDYEAQPLHVIGLTSCAELSLPPLRRANLESFGNAATAAAASAALVAIPFSGRRRAVVWILPATDITYSVELWRCDRDADTIRVYEIRASTALNVQAQINVGGSNEDEYGDLLVVKGARVGEVDVSVAIDYEVAGEFGS